MSNRHRGSRWPQWIVALLALALGASLSMDAPWAQEAAEEAIPPRPPRTRTPFQPYPADPGALAYETLSDGPIPHIDVDPEAGIDAETYAIIANETRASVDDAQAWGDLAVPPAMHQAFAAGSAIARAEAAVTRAEYEAGLTGIADVGVEP
jgi:hypothetical protein